VDKHLSDTLALGGAAGFNIRVRWKAKVKKH
jgi:hypothetical protein